METTLCFVALKEIWRQQSEVTAKCDLIHSSEMRNAETAKNLYSYSSVVIKWKVEKWSNLEYFILHGLLNCLILRKYCTSKRRESFTQWRSVTFLNTAILTFEWFYNIRSRFLFLFLDLFRKVNPNRKSQLLYKTQYFMVYSTVRGNTQVGAESLQRRGQAQSVL